MFYRLTGTLCYADATTVAVDCNGIAFQCQVSMNTRKQLAEEGETVTLYTYLNVKQDGVDLFGFYHKEELETFKLLISVSGVGPKAALSILSVLDPSQLALAVATGDTKAIQQAQGVGKKVADRVVLELKDKLKMDGSGATTQGSSNAGVAPLNGTQAAEAIAALVQLGYNQSEASIAVSKVDQTLPAGKIISLALKNLL